MANSLTLVIDLEGHMRFIYDDELTELLDEGDSRIERASHVEPNAQGQWEADLSPVNGPMLGPFIKRQEALDAEVAWLHCFHLGCGHMIASEAEEWKEKEGVE